MVINMKLSIISTIVLGILILTSTINFNAAPANNEEENTNADVVPKPIYGYIIPVNPDDNGNETVNIARAINELL